MINIKREIQRAIYGVTDELGKIFDADKEYYLEHSSSNFKVRPGYGYDKFYLDWVEGSYDMSLQSLIHFILFEKRYLKHILSSKTYKSYATYMKTVPEGLYDFGRNEKEQQIIDDIEWVTVCFVASCFEEAGLDNKAFIDAGYINESSLPNISKRNIFYDRVINRSFFYNLDSYLKENNKLSDDELNKIVKLSESIEDISNLIFLMKIIYPISKNISKKIIEIAIFKAFKNSEFTIIAKVVNSSEYFNDSEWNNRILALKK